MPDVRLADIYDAEVYRDLEPVNSPERTAFYEAGLIVRDEALDELAMASGKTADMPFWNDIDASAEPNYGNDDPNDEATPAKVTQGEQIARKAFVNKGFSAMNLVRELQTGDDALQHIRNRFGTFWMRAAQRRLIAMARGIHADNVANDSGDMTHDIAAEAIANQTAATRWSRSAFIDAAFTMGDRVDGVSAVGVHSMVAKQITEQNDAEDVRDSEGNLLYQTYLGRRIIVDDGLPAIAGGTDGLKYMSVLYGPGAFGWGEGLPVNATEVANNPRAGNGAGQEELWERKTWLLHAAGFQNTGVPADVSFTLAELATAAVWDRVVERKNVPLAFLWTN